MARHWLGVEIEVCMRPGLVRCDVLLPELDAVLPPPEPPPQNLSQPACCRSTNAWRRAISSGSLRTLLAQPAVRSVAPTSSVEIRIRDIAPSYVVFAPSCRVCAGGSAPCSGGMDRQVTNPPHRVAGWRTAEFPGLGVWWCRLG